MEALLTIAFLAMVVLISIVLSKVSTLNKKIDALYTAQWKAWQQGTPVVQPTYAPPQGKPAAQPMPLQVPLPTPPQVPSPIPYGPPGVSQVKAPQPTPRPAMKFNENFLGRNLLPLIAAVLGLIGLVFLGVLVVPYLSDGVKIAGMFLISFLIGGGGYLLHRRKASILTQALLGTGIGGVFISILVTHVFFHAIHDVLAFSLLGIWVLVSMWLSKHTNSLLVAILAHVGMVASIGYGYLGGLADDKLLLLVIYQIVATAAIIVGNVMWVKVMYRWGLFASQAMIILSLGVMIPRLIGGTALVDFKSQLPVGLIVAAFAVQFVGATLIAYLLFVSIARVKGQEARTILAVTNSSAWITVVLLSCTVLVLKLLGMAYHQKFFHYVPEVYYPALGITVVVGFLPAMVMAFTQRRIPIVRGLQLGTLIPLAAVSAFLMILVAIIGSDEGMIQPLMPTITWIILLALAYLGVGLLSGTQVMRGIGRVLLIVDAVWMLFPPGGYLSLVAHWGLAPGIGYVVALVGLAYLTCRQVSDQNRTRHQPAVIMSIVVGAAISLAVVCFHAGKTIVYSDARGKYQVFDGYMWYAGGIGLVLCALMVGFIQFSHKAIPPVFYRLWELMLIIIASVQLYQAGWAWHSQLHRAPEVTATHVILQIIFASLALVVLVLLQIDWIRRTAKATSFALRTPGAPPVETRGEIISGIALTIAAVGLFTPYQWFINHQADWQWGFPTSLACMVAALVIVGLGLWSRSKSLRLYGLVVVVICVLKLVTLDIGSVDSITRVVAFLGGAAVCFGISALYNYAAKQFDKTLSNLEPQVLVQVGQGGETPVEESLT
ncbi:MAG: DUF2339 domain-containing protein [Propionibacteriaceae bacterium]|nr:DUF2339 domain-containing protein [Propionibacteriaceae bacterium]